MASGCTRTRETETLEVFKLVFNHQKNKSIPSLFWLHTNPQILSDIVLTIETSRPRNVRGCDELGIALQVLIGNRASHPHAVWNFGLCPQSIN